MLLDFARVVSYQMELLWRSILVLTPYIDSVFKLRRFVVYRRKIGVSNMQLSRKVFATSCPKWGFCTPTSFFGGAQVVAQQAELFFIVHRA